MEDSPAIARGSLATFLRLSLVAATLVAAILLLTAGLLGSYTRLYASWSGSSLIALADGQDTVPSRIAPVAWMGNEPFTVRSKALVEGARVEVELRAAEGHVPVRLLVDGRLLALLDVHTTWKTYRVWLQQGGSRLQLVEPDTVHVPVHMARIKITNVAGFTEGVLNAWIVRRNTAFWRAPAHSRWALFLLVLVSALLVTLGAESKLASIRLLAGWCAGGIALSAVALGTGRLLTTALGFRLIVTPGTAAAILLTSAVAGCLFQLVPRFRISDVRAIRILRQARESLVVVLFIVTWAAALFILVQARFGGDLRGVARFGWNFPLALVSVAAPVWAQRTDVFKAGESGDDITYGFQLQPV